MQETPRKSLYPRFRYISGVFAAAFLILVIGILVGRQADNLAGSMVKTVGEKAIPAAIYVYGAADPTTFRALELAVMIAVATALLAGWTIYLSIKSVAAKRKIKESQRRLQIEIARQRCTSDELHVTHQQLSSTARQLGGILEGTSDFIAAIDTSLRYISFNDAYRQNISELFKKEPVRGATVSETLVRYPSKRDISVRLWQRALAGEKFNATQEFTDEQGNTFHYELSYTPIIDDNGEVTGAAQITRDVTERRRTEDLLKQEMDFVSAAIDVNSSLVIVLDLEGRIIRFNQACEKLSGYKFEEVRGRLFWNVLVPTEDIAKIKASYRNFYSTFFSADYVNQWITKDEQLRLISWQVSAIKDDQGQIKYIVGTGIDITEKRDIETARNRMLKILENSPDLVSIYDFQGRMTYLNPAGRKLLGLTADCELDNVRLHAFLPEHVNTLLQAEAIPTAVERGSWLGTGALKLPDGKEIPISQLILAHQNEKGKIEYFSTVIRDISSQKELEDVLAEARDGALEAIRNKSDFLANMSHEIRTPMSGIVGISELMLGTPLNDEQKDYTETIQKCGESLLTIINDILDFSKLEAGKLQFENVDFDLNELVDSVSELFTQTVFKKGLELSVLVNHDVPTKLNGDAGRIRQILTNLVSNAIKFTDKGTVVVRVTVDDPGDEPLIRFEVKDTGVGIPAGQSEGLFLPYSQARPKGSRDYGGTGLGLAICKQIVEVLGGSIGFESEPGIGSTFWFCVPFEMQAEAAPPAELKALRHSRVLIIDDNDTNRRVLLHQAKSWGMMVDEAASGESGLSLLRAAARNKEGFEFAVVDLNMPGMNGIEFAEQVKADIRLRRTKVVLMASAAHRSKMSGPAGDSIDAFISKPLRLTDVLETLASVKLPREDQGFEETGPTHISLGTENGAGAGARILIVEDNLVNRKVLSNQVRRLGFEVDIVENGLEAVEAVMDNHYCLVLMDCEMPGMDGFEATRKIREVEPQQERIPIIAVTAHVRSGEREKCFAAGMDGYLSKPTRQKDLKATIDKWVGTSRTAEDHTPVNLARNGHAGQTEEENVRARLYELEKECGPEVVAECISLFMNDSRTALGHLSEAIDQEDFERATAEAHKLKGSTANMGALVVSDICQELMLAAKKKHDRDLKGLLALLTSKLDELAEVYAGHQRTFDAAVSAREADKVPTGA